jgi:hypothetical protein
LQATFDQPKPTQQVGMLRKLISRRRLANNSSDQPQSTDISDGHGSHGDSQMGDSMQGNDERSLSRCCPCFTKRTQNQSSAEDKKQPTSPWALQANEQLSPRSSAWLYLAAVSLMGLGTFLVVEGSDSVGVGRSHDDTLMLAIFSTCFSVSVVISLGYRHRSLRNAFTCDLRWIYYSIEFILSIILFCLWCVIMRMLMDPDPFAATMNFAVTTVATAAGSTQIIWNINLWVCAWLGYGLLSYLVGSLLLASPVRKRGTWSSAVLAKTKRHRYEFEESRWTYWFMYLAFQLALSAFSIKLRVGDVCASTLGITPFCKRSSLGSGVGLANAVIACASFFFCRLDQMGKFDHWGSSRGHKLWCIESFLSLLSLIMSCFNLGYSTSPGGPATELGNMFVTSIVGVALSLMLCEQVLDSCTLRVCATEEDASEFEQDVPLEEQLDLEMGKKRIFSTRLSARNGQSSSSSSSSSGALREYPYPPDFGHDEAHDGAESSSYSLPAPAPLNASNSSATNYDSSSYEESQAESGIDQCSLSVNRGTVNATSSEDDTDLNSESGVDLCFQPDDDVSSIDCSIPSKMVASQVSRMSSIDPDGYKSEDNYNAREMKVPTAQIMRLGTSKQKQKNKASNKFNRKRKEVLVPVAEQRLVNAQSSDVDSPPDQNTRDQNPSLDEVRQ